MNGGFSYDGFKVLGSMRQRSFGVQIRTECAFIVIYVDSESKFKRHVVKCEEKAYYLQMLVFVLFFVLYIVAVKIRKIQYILSVSFSRPLADMGCAVFVLILDQRELDSYICMFFFFFIVKKHFCLDKCMYFSSEKKKKKKMQLECPLVNEELNM